MRPELDFVEFVSLSRLSLILLLLTFPFSFLLPTLLTGAPG